LENITARELQDQGISPVEVEPGGILFKGDLASLYRLNFHLRTANRILARLGNFFRATSFPDLKQRLVALPWERFLTPGKPVSLRVTCHHSRLYHSNAVARTLLSALEKRLGQPSPLIKASEESGQDSQLVVVRFLDDICTVSVDSSGAPLYKRGYRQAVAKAPLRETLAAAMLIASGWDKETPLLDPFCGSSTIPIEAALMAVNIPSGINRQFAFMQWSNFNKTLWESIRGQSFTLNGQIPPILASDRDAGAIRISRANAKRAGVAHLIEFKCQAVSSISPPARPGWVVTNPPYGARLNQGGDLRDLYAQFGNVLRQNCPGWNLSVLCSDPVLLGQMRFMLDTTLTTTNGGISVKLSTGLVA
jgi:putative N6-adenine-specific DNA methylase